MCRTRTIATNIDAPWLMRPEFRQKALDLATVSMFRLSKMSLFRKLLRTLLLWAVMLAVPFQGYAAATMQFCTGSDASAKAVAVSEPDVAHDHGQQAHSQAQAHSHSHANDSHHLAAAWEVEGNPHHHAEASGDADSTHKCGTCGACHSVALVGTMPVVIAPALPPAALAEPFSVVASLTHRVLDKPPRA